MNKTTEKEIKELRVAKKKAMKKHDLFEAAKFCNVLGEILAKNGLYDEAIIEHKEEVSLSEKIRDDIGVAVGHRKVGECYSKLENFDQALYHTNLHLELSKKCNNLEEVQRALATIGLVHHEYAEYLEGSIEKNQQYKKAEQAFFKSLDVCDELRNKNVCDHEILKMRERLYLNLGNIYDALEDYDEALRYINKALVICREEKLKEDIYLCQFTLAGIYLKVQSKEKALRAAHDAVSIAKETNDKAMEIEALVQQAKVFFQLSDIKKAFMILKTAYKISTKKKIRFGEYNFLKSVMTGKRLLSQIEKSSDQKELLALSEKLGDWYAEVKKPQQALDCYLKQLELSALQGISGKALAQLYVSIAITYAELEDFPNALLYYNKEIENRDGDFKEKSETYCEIAKLMDEVNYPMEEIKDVYMKAVKNAQATNKRKVIVDVYQQWIDYLHFNGENELMNVVKSELKQIEDEYHDEESEDHSEEEQVIDDDYSSSQLNDEELQMLMSDDEDEDDLEEQQLTDGTSIKRRKSKKGINKVNIRGETALHTASIGGETERVRWLLKQGADVNARDVCGWQPLHEACNLGHTDIALLLLEAGANVNDQGGVHCRGISPLHDAAVNGHFDVVKLLVNHGANINLKTKDGETALDLLQVSLRYQLEEYGTLNKDSKLLEGRQKIEKFLLNIKSKPTQNTSSRNNGLELAFDFSDSESDSDDIPKKRKRSVESPCSPCIISNTSAVRSDRTGIEKALLVDNDLDNVSKGSSAAQSDNDMSDSLVEDIFAFEQIDMLDDNDVLSSTAVDGHTQVHNTRNRNVVEINKPSNNKEKVDKSKASYMQTRINYVRTPSPALIEEHNFTPINDNFIINDMNKKKRAKPHQSTIDFERVTTSTALKPKQKKRKLNENSSTKNSSSYTADPTNVDIMDLSDNVSIINDLTQHSNVFRIKVRIYDQLLLIPCTHMKSANIGWLAEQVKQRYLKISGLSLKISLNTKDGALLNNDDVISDVIMNNEELIGESTGTDFPPFSCRYKENCRKYNQVLIEDIINQVESRKEIYIKNKRLKKQQLTATVESISFDEQLNILNITNCFIESQTMKLLFRNVSLLPNLHSLTLSCVGMATKDIHNFSKEFDLSLLDQQMRLLKVRPLSNVVTLDFSYNDFSNDENIFISSLSRIIKQTNRLQHLSLKSCDINLSCFNQSNFLEILQDRSMTSFDVSGNNIDTHVDTLINMTSNIQLTTCNLNNCRVCHEKLNLSQICCIPNVKELSLDNIETKNEIELFSDDFPSEDCRINKISMKNFKDLTKISFYGICRLFGTMTSLISLDLSFSSSIDIRFFNMLLKNFRNNQSNIEKLYMRGCSFLNNGEESDSDFHMVCENIKSKEIRLNFIDMSLSTFEFDVDKMVESWRERMSCAKTDILVGLNNVYSKLTFS